MLLHAKAELNFTELGKKQIVDLGLSNPFTTYKDIWYCKCCGFVDPAQVIYMSQGDIFCFKHAPVNALIAIVELFVELAGKKLISGKQNQEFSKN